MTEGCRLDAQLGPARADCLDRAASRARAALSRPGARAAVFRALYLGDLLCSIPAVRSLRQAYPGLSLTLISLEWARDFAARFAHYFDDFIAVPPLPGLHDSPSSCAGVRRALASIRSRRFDVALQMHGCGPVSNDYVALMGAGLTAGYFPPGCPRPDGAYFEYPAAGSEARRNLALARLLGGADSGAYLELPVTPGDRAELAATLSRAGVRLGRYVCVHAGARLASRRWPAKRFAEVADALAERGLQVVLTGSAAEAPLTGAVSRVMRHVPLDLAGRTTLGALAALVAGAELLVSNDTGLAHVAAALATPSVVVASGSDPERWAAEGSGLNRTLAYDIDCRPCMHGSCPIGHPCALGVTVEMVLQEADELLAALPGRRR